jgi:purine-binding chemotaxis protein CheW
MKTVESALESSQYCTFEGGGELREQPLTPVPLAPPEIAGLLNLRGQILPAIDLRRRLGFAEEGATRSVSVIFASPDGPVDFLADHVGDVLTLDATSWEEPPDTLKGRLREAVQGVHKLKDQLLLVLDPAKAANLETEV